LGGGGEGGFSFCLPLLFFFLSFLDLVLLLFFSCPSLYRNGVSALASMTCT
jgi:hypothetical protein